MTRRLVLPAALTIALLAAAPAAAKAPEFVPGQVIVKFEADSSRAERAAAQRSAGVRGPLSTILGTGGASVAETVRGVGTAVNRLEASNAVVYAEPNYIYRASAVPGDPRFDELWGLDNSGQTGGTPDADIDAPEGWDGFGLAGFPASGGAKVGVVDTGIAQNHADLAGKVADCGGVNNFGFNLVVLFLFGDPTIVDGKCADNNGHGTHVSGTITANANNGVGVAGVAFNSPLAVCKALNGSGAGTVETVANCIAWTNEHGAKIISMSLGGAGSEALASAVQNATANGSLLVAAAGNSGSDTLEYPASYPEVVSVSATDDDDQLADFSTFNSEVEIAAPGVDVLSTTRNGGYGKLSGTSMATPHVAGVAALIAGANPAGSPASWRATLDAAVDDLGAPGRDPQFGFGRVNLANAAP